MLIGMRDTDRVKAHSEDAREEAHDYDSCCILGQCAAYRKSMNWV